MTINVDRSLELPESEYFPEPQAKSGIVLGRLVDDPCERFAIPRVDPEQPFLSYGDALESFAGVIGHAMVRSAKSDPARDPELWSTLETTAGLRPVAAGAGLLAGTVVNR